jgi:hypothetical protein
MCIEQSYDGLLKALTIRNKDTDAAAATALSFSLNRSGGDQDFEAGEIKLVKEQAWTTTSSTIDGAMVFSTISNGTMAEKLRIDSLGNIGVNQTSVNSSRKMEITQPSSYTSGLRINSAGSAGNGAYVEFFVGTANYKIGGDHNTNALLFKKDGTEYMRHDSSGHLQIRREGIGNFSGTDSRHTRYIIKQTNGQEAIAGSVFAQGKSNWGGDLVFASKQANGNPSTGLTERMRLNAAGQLTIPQQPTFNAKLSTATSAGFTGILVFNTVDYNIGSHYNNSNGKFTAPIDGRYLFAWYTNVVRTGGNGSVWGDWYVNGVARNNRFYTYYSGAWELIGGTIILDLNANDYLQVYVGVGGQYDGSSYGSFSGTLLG